MTQSNVTPSFRNPLNFFDRFRIVAAGFLNYAADRRDDSPVYDDCPRHCDILDEDRTSFCSACPVGIARAEFENDCRETLADMPGERFGFDYLYRCLVEVQNAGQLPPELETLTTARLRGIVDAERGRIDRINQWNKDQTNAANAARNAGNLY